MQKIAIYLRVNNNSKDDLKTQREKLIEYCKLNNLEIVKEYVDNGYSANDISRPGYNSMLEDMKKNMFDKIVVSNLSKLTRQITELAKISELLIQYNCSLISIKEQIGSNSKAVDTFILRIITLINKELEGC